MKDFLKIMVASAVGFLIAQILIGILATIMFIGMAGSALSTMSTEKFNLQNNSVLNLRLDGTIVERVAEPDPFTSMLSSQYPSAMGLNDIVGAIRKAKSNDNIKGIYIDSRMVHASMATLAEIREELLDFKESGKFIVSYADSYTQTGYYLASVADKVF